MKNESDRNRFNHINLYFIRCLLDKTYDPLKMRLGDRQTEKSKKDKVRNYASRVKKTAKTKQKQLNSTK